MVAALTSQWPRVDDAQGLKVAGLLAAAAGPLVWSTFLLVCDLRWINWHENEFYAGMRYGTYKSHLRITIEPPEVVSTAGQMKVDVHTIRKPKKSKRKKREEQESSDVGLLYSFSVLADPQTEEGA